MFDPLAVSEPTSAWRMKAPPRMPLRSIVVAAAAVAAFTAVQAALAWTMLAFVRQAQRGELASGLPEAMAIGSCATMGVLVMLAALLILKAHERSRSRL